MSTRILLIGAGAVGQVYGCHFARAGHAVSFFVREKYREEMTQGLVLHALNADKRRQSPIRFSQYDVLTRWDEVAATRWDLVILCISTDALHHGFDLDALAGALGDATLLVLQPGPRDLALVTTRIPADQCVQGIITLSSYHSPMPGEDTAVPGTAYWIPPLAPMPLAGPQARRDAVIDTYRSAGIRAAAVGNLQTSALFGNAFFMLFLEALEAKGWSLRALRRDKALLRDVLSASEEAFAGIAAEHGITPPWGIRLAAPWMLQAALRFAPLALPFDIERFLEVHFTKVGTQTRMLVQHYIDDARRHGVSATVMESLHGRL